MQRVRMLLPFLKENNWQAEVLAVSSGQVAAPIDPWLLEASPVDLPVHRVDAFSLAWSRIPGLGGLGQRAFVQLANQGRRVLTAGRFDLIYFSTTVFEILVLGLWWERKFDIPYVIDYQNPWVSDYYSRRPAVRPPGGRLINPYLLARKPLLAVYHQQSPINSIISAVGGCVFVPFSESLDEELLANNIFDAWISRRQFETLLPLDSLAYEPYTDRCCAATLCTFLQDCLTNA